MKLALFDLDGTLLATDSDHAFGDHLVHIGWADADEFRRLNDFFFQQYQAGCLDINAYIDFATRPWRERDAPALAQVTQAFMAQRVRPALHDSALALVREHQQAGDAVAIITATNEFITRPIADAFGVRDLIATELARDEQGRVNGRIRGTPSFREGKVARLDQWLKQRGQTRDSFECIYFYSDSTNDLPLLEQVSHPVATNPSPALAQIAQARGWPILKLFDTTPA
jgi:HAD superfamily hydrolase (TIGR01490 family)